MERDTTPHIKRKTRSKRKGTGRIAINMNIAATAEERARIDAIAAAHGVGRSTLVRTIIFNNLEAFEQPL